MMNKTISLLLIGIFVFGMILINGFRIWSNFFGSPSLKLNETVFGVFYRVPTDPTARVIGFRTCEGKEYCVSFDVFKNVLKKINATTFPRGTFGLVNPTIKTGWVRVHGYEPGASMKCDIIENIEKIISISNNSECIPSKPVLFKDVFIITDKIEYKLGERVKIILKNRLSRTIQYWQNDTWFEIQRLEYEKGIPARWTTVRVYNPCLCGTNCEPQGFFELKPKSEIWFFWDQKEGCERKQVDAGEYRVSAKVKINGKVKTLFYEFIIK